MTERRRILVTLALVGLLLAAVPLTYLGWHYLLRHLPTLFARPLEPAAAAELCAMLGLEGDPRCSAGQAYGFEFLPDLLERYPRGVPGGPQSVAAELAPYQLECTGWIERAGQGDFRDCQYGFQRDRDYLLHLTLRKETGAAEGTEQVWRTCSYALGNRSLWDLYACRPALNSGFLLVMSDNTFLIGRGFATVFALTDLLLLAALVLLWRREGGGR